MSIVSTSSLPWCVLKVYPSHVSEPFDRPLHIYFVCRELCLVLFGLLLWYTLLPPVAFMAFYYAHQEIWYSLGRLISHWSSFLSAAVLKGTGFLLSVVPHLISRDTWPRILLDTYKLLTFQLKLFSLPDILVPFITLSKNTYFQPR